MANAFAEEAKVTFEAVLLFSISELAIFLKESKEVRSGGCRGLSRGLQTIVLVLSLEVREG